MIDCRVVLVRPHFAGNIGATARVMHNFGFSKLVLIDPVADHRSEEARRLSTHGEFILEQAIVTQDFLTAVADCVLVVATSGKVEGVERETSSDSARRVMPRVVEAGETGPVAIVFGPEPSGLTTAEVNRCHLLLNIPTNPEFPALNLAQAVAICLYELSQTKVPANSSQTAGEQVASFAEQEQMFLHLRQALEAIHFLYGPKADSLMHGVRHLIGRAGPTPTEVKILHGLARQIEWVVRHAVLLKQASRDESENRFKP
jgi:tRNA/rRNA methyltransferase